jgi:sodium/pantothenate symporter
MVLAWILFGFYLLGTAWLGWQGHKQTKDFGSFAIGKGDLSALQVGVTLAAATASAATFIINPGFVYVDGLAAFMHLGLSVYLGFTGMLVLLSFKFRKMGEKMGALTIPDWVGKRYRSRNFSLYFGFVNILSFAFVVLLVGGISIVMQTLLGVTNTLALIITLGFVTSYVLIGGTYAHVYTNMLQGFLMIGVSLIVLYSGVKMMISIPDFTNQLTGVSEYYLAPVNPESKFYKDYFSVYFSGVMIGAALVCQPHILTKALYVKSDAVVKRYIIIFSVVFLLFTLLLSAGFWTHLKLSPEQLTDPATGVFRQDLVMTNFLKSMYPDWTFTIISVVLLAAAMSTLDGLLVGISTITANDVVVNLLDRKSSGSHFKPEDKMRMALKVSQLVLIIIAVAAFLVALHPPPLLGIFGQAGVYGLVLAALVPVLCGVFFVEVHLKAVWALSILAIFIHFLLFFKGMSLFPDSNLAFENPGFTATIAAIITVIPGLFYHFLLNRN